MAVVDFVHSEVNWCHKKQRLRSSILSEAQGPQQKRRVGETAKAACDQCRPKQQAALSDHQFTLGRVGPSHLKGTFLQR